MAVNDDFTGSSGQLLHATAGAGGAQRTSASGHTWTAQSGHAGVLELTGSGTAFHSPSGTGGGTQHSLQGTGAAVTVDGSACVVTLDIKSVAGVIAVCNRVNAACDQAYQLYYAAGEWALYRQNSSVSFTKLAGSGATTPSTGAHTVSIACTGTGASVSILCKLDGSDLFGGAVVDSSGSRITALGFIGLYSDTVVSSTTGFHFNYIELDDGSADTTAPVLSSPVGTQTGSTTATIGATTDEANGTIYGYVSTSATPPSDADLKAGTGAVWAGSAAVSSTGAKTLSATGLTASTGYYAHLLHTDAAANDSNTVTSAQFTTAAGGGSAVGAAAHLYSQLRRH